MPIPPEVKKVVAFIFIPSEDGKLVPNGTGFFIGVKIPDKPETFAVYLVTVKHVLQKPNSDSFFPAVFFRLNRKEGEAEMIHFPLIKEGLKKNIFMHEDPSVDLAVVPLLPNQNKYDFKFLPDDFITTKDDFVKLKIREGSEVFFTGLFLSHLGEHKNYPIVRFGKVALVSEEKIDWDGVSTELYLIESMSYGGNSGSPVFFYLGAEREPGTLFVGNPVFKLAGVIKGFFGEKRPLEIVETARVPIVNLNIGISAVIPAYKLNEILFSEELKKQRKL